MAPSKTVRHLLVHAGFLVLVGLVRCLPIETASNFGGWVSRQIGPRTKRHARAHRHLAHVFTEEKSLAEREAIAMEMWDTMGRIFVETLMIPRLLKEHDRFEMTAAQLALDIRDDGKGAIFVGGHYGNWEIAMFPPTCFGQNPVGIYRRIENPYTDRYLQRLRSRLYPGGMLLKDGLSAPKLIELLKKGAHIGILCDQRERRGIVLPFLGQPAPTMGLPALLAHRLKVPLVAGRVIRLPGVRFRFECYTVELDTAAPLKDAVNDAMGSINDLLSDWIREYPGQWMWTHRRWDLVEVARAREEERRNWDATSSARAASSETPKPAAAPPADA